MRNSTCGCGIAAPPGAASRQAHGVHHLLFVPDERKNGGSYQTVTGSVKRIDAVNGVIQMADRQCIPIADVFSIEIIP